MNSGLIVKLSSLYHKEASEIHFLFQRIGTHFGDGGIGIDQRIRISIQGLLQSFSERDRAILELSLQGEKPVHISERVGCAERTVERVLERIRQRLEKMTGGGNEK